ncbi:metal-dependent protease of the PAD1/JAB1 superfamily [Methanocella sp. CWC-04]|uniref:Metal-dependent protease of the PAD1/JAB1 superfamily n=1 Tax=Methanooceanicella nereidis TaxID=2052831 RepID=A0AAP2RET4_9EURY|nr:Mov34/MPN/PAD-1 family protein [Methanocella sp. CWC-04]MCD1295491.1 metal-dependent protease of the PAD1/JAB1 superfamily [Methanocella sp. CWC-04]
MASGKKRVTGISAETLNLILEVSRSTHPNEFAGLLRATKGVISDVILVPGTTSNDTSARMLLDMMPLDLSIVGSVHSHPVHDLRYSSADLNMFGCKGPYNIIVAYPYTEKDWVCYDPSGKIIELQVVDEEQESA